MKTNIYFILILILPVCGVIYGVRRQIMLWGLFNFPKEIRKVKVKNKPPKYTANEATAFIGTTPSKKPVLLPDNSKHVFVCGTTGSGKTVAISNFIKNCAEKGYPALIIDGKGDMGEGSILDITRKLAGGRKVYVINLNDPEHSNQYNPFKDASPTIVKDMLINMTNWSEEHYKLNTERYLQRVVSLICKYNAPMSFRNIIKSIPADNFTKLSMELLKKELISKIEHQENLDIAKASGKIAEGASARFSTIAESDIGSIFDTDGIDIYSAFEENAIILFILNPLIYPEISPLFGKLLMIDAKKAVYRLFGSKKRTFFIFDEIASYASNSMLDLVNKSRSANVTCVLATQSLSDLDSANGTFFKEQVIENCNNYIVLRQNSSINAEHWSNILGTRNTMEVTYQLQQRNLNTASTGLGSARRVREFLYHPDDIKTLKTGMGVYLSKDSSYHSRVIINKPF